MLKSKGVIQGAVFLVAALFIAFSLIFITYKLLGSSKFPEKKEALVSEETSSNDITPDDIPF